jgi:mRNA interferase HigB
MRVHVIKEQTIEDYVICNNQSRIPFKNWLNRIKESDWSTPIDLIHTFNDADLLGKRTKRVIFNIGGKKFRMICTYHFGRKRIHLFINWIGTHAEYSRLCDSKSQYTISDY